MGEEIKREAREQATKAQKYRDAEDARRLELGKVKERLGRESAKAMQVRQCATCSQTPSRWVPWMQPWTLEVAMRRIAVT